MIFYISTDGDDIGTRVGRAALANCEDEMVQLSGAIKRANQQIVSFALANGGKVLTEGGDECNFTIPGDRLDQIDNLRQQWRDAAGATLSVGIGRNISEAGRALMAAKLRGKDQIVLYSPEVEAEIQELEQGIEAGPSEEGEREKIAEGYFKAEDLAKARKGLPVGTIRNWGGTDYIKHVDGWVVYTGKHQGKLMGKFKEDPKEHHKLFITEHQKKTATPPPDPPSKEPPSPDEPLAPPSKEPTDAPPEQPPQDDESPGIPGEEKAPGIPVSEPEEPPTPAGQDDEPEESPAGPDHFEDHLTASTPREEAAQDLKTNQEDYINARKSKFGNKGEDILKSARHKALEWKGLKSLEDAGDAERVIKRDKLLELQPPKFAEHLTDQNHFVALPLYFALKRLPPAPVSAWLKGRSTASDDEVVYYEVSQLSGGTTKIQPRTFEHLKETGQLPGEVVATMTVGDVKKKARQDYLAAYEHIKELAEHRLEEAKEGGTLQFDVQSTLEKFRADVSNYIRELRSVDRYSDMGNALVPFVNRILGTRHPTAQSVMVDIGSFVKAAMTHYGIDTAAALRTMKESMLNDVKAVVEGQDYRKLYGIESEKKPQGITMADFYVSHAKRTGFTTEFKTPKEQEEFLMKKAGIRGLQWGNSVSDTEREHHLKMSAEALKDLVDVLGLPDEMVSFNGRLGLAIGARGKGRALAHYEPTLRVINLTRAGGAGSLAHEWGHFWDNIAAKSLGVEGTNYVTSKSEISARYGATRPHANPTIQAVDALYKSDAYRAIVKRVSEAVAKSRPRGGHAYWMDPKEMWARSFEVYVQFKLDAAGKINTYLSGVSASDLWPSSVEIAQLEPYFDRIFEVFRTSGDLKKTMDWLRKDHVMPNTPVDNDQMDYELPERTAEEAPEQDGQDLRSRIRNAIARASSLAEQKPDQQEGEEEMPEGAPMGSPGGPEPTANDQMPPEAMGGKEDPAMQEGLPEGGAIPTSGNDAEAGQPGGPEGTADVSQDAAPAPDAEATPPADDVPPDGESRDAVAPADEQAPPADQATEAAPEAAAAQDAAPAGDEDATRSKLRNLIGDVLAQVHEAAPQLEALKQKQPEIFAVIHQTIEAMLDMAKAVLGGEEEPEAQPEQAQQVPETQPKPEEKPPVA